MGKNIFAVFEKMTLRTVLMEYFQDATVERIFMDQDKNEMHIHMNITQIVHPKFIQELEREIYVYLGEPKGMELFIKERFQLAFELELPYLYEFYKEALIYDLKRINPICGATLKESQTIIAENEIKYLIDKNGYDYLENYKMDQLISQIFDGRFGRQVTVIFEKIDQANALYEEFIQNRDREQSQLISTLVTGNSGRETNKVITKEMAKENVKEESYDLVVGKKPITGEIIRIRAFDEGTEEAVIEVQVFDIKDARELRGGKVLVLFDATDYSGSMTIKCFVEKDQYEKKTKNTLKKGKFYRIKGNYKFDTYEKGMRLFANTIEEISDFRAKGRMDNASQKRVELHFHTQMSDMDGMVSAKDAVKRAAEWGHKAIAITDHGVVQAYPEAFHAYHDYKTPDGEHVKIIYGVEGYLVDDTKPIVRDPRGQSLQDTYVVFDIETTGLRAKHDCITEIGAVKIVGGQIVDRYSTFINPLISIPQKIQELTSITNQMVKDAPLIHMVLPDFLAFCEGAVMVAQNADFDMSFILHQVNLAGLSFNPTILDTLEMARLILPELKNYKLDTLAKAVDVRLVNHHRAVYDAEATALILLKFFKIIQEDGVENLDQMPLLDEKYERNYKKYRPNHVIILAQTRAGLLNLYKMISMSHMDYYYKTPRIPKSLLNKHRDGLIIGSACENSEVYKVIMEGKLDAEVKRVVEFYDYLEIQPTGNNAFMIANEMVKDVKALQDINKEIIVVGRAYGKPTVATCDVHFMNPEDEVYRRILMAGKGFGDSDNQPPLFFRTTDEMLREFSYLGDELAREVVVTNTNLVNDWIEVLEPVERDKYPPVIEGSDTDLARICNERAIEIYGEPLPEIVDERLKRELNSIISNGFAVMYMIAQKLVKKSNDDGYLVGSRGSVGSSFAATMAGITEVNPLSPHYICTKCKYSDFDSPEVRKYAQNSGVDMPDKKCPVCGENLMKEGHDIPFETFLGFKGNKEPDIDLNFSGEYQSKAHEYTEVLFGKGHVFRAGTIGTLADKTAYGYVKNYFEERNIQVNEAEITRLIQGCVGVRRTTGQHPGGIIVVPRDQEIYKFTPIQRPANDVTSNIITTHFDYHSIDHNLLKLDILGHDDPTMIKMLEDLTGVVATDIPLDEPKVMSLFASTQALGISPDDIDGCLLGSLGIPEFGTDFVMQMLLETKPKSFSDLVRISGLSHGTDVWTNNAQELVKQGTADISTVISTRDDIMTYLINQGMDKELSFTIMESVRKGKGLKPDWEVEMAKNDVPDWYIWSCKQIKYMFPKAHAAAYVMMAYRIAYFKVYYPKAYYTAFFSIRAANFDFEMMCKGRPVLDKHLKDYKQRFNDLSKKEKDMIKDFKIVQEMYARGIEFEPINLFTVDAKYFQIVNNKIMPSLSAIQGLGERAAESIVLASKNGPYISVEDFRNRTKISKTLIDMMVSHQILEGLPETNQISLF